MELRFFLLFITFTFALFTQALAGFGSQVVALTLAGNLYPMKWLVPSLVPFSVVLSLYLVIRYLRFIDRKVLFINIFPLMGLGLVIGLLFFYRLEGLILKRIFGLLVLVLSLREMIFIQKKEAEVRAGGGFIQRVWLFLAGVIHGIYAAGGPLLVYGISRFKLDKMVFRATLSAVWLMMDGFLFSNYLYSGKYDENCLKLTLKLIPAMPLGLLCGEIFHRRISKRAFMLFTYFILLIGSLTLLIF